MAAVEPGVDRLDAETMRERVARPEPVLVLFYADWCGFCTRFLAPWRERVPRIEVETVAADVSDWDDPRWEVHDVEAVPTLALFANGKEVARLAAPLGVGIEMGELDRFLATLRVV